MLSWEVKIINKYLIEEAVVFVAGENYNIIWNTTEKGLAWVKVENSMFYDEINGNIKSEEKIHKVIVPMDILDNAKEYTICFKRIFERLPYNPTSEDFVETKTYKFKPVENKDNIKLYMIADTHSEHIYAIKSGKYFDKQLDLLILNGDIVDNSKDLENILTIFRVASGITKGELPVVYARGNHDTRGMMAPDLHKYIGTDDGNMYFTFKLGKMFGIVLDGGEDKIDTHKEYGGMANFEPYRESQVQFLDEIIRTAEYKDYVYVVVICHIRINANWNEAFKDTYKKWLDRLNEISPDIMLCGHEHEYYLLDKDDKFFDGTPFEFPVVVGSICLGNSNISHADEPADFIGTGMELYKDGIDIKFTNSKNEIIEKHIIDRKNNFKH